MPGNVTHAQLEDAQIVSSAELAAHISAADFSHCSATVVGYGYMGRHYVNALRALGIGRITVCSRSTGPLSDLKNQPGVAIVSGGIETFQTDPEPGSLAIVATPASLLISAAQKLASLGFKKILVEKPVSLYSEEINQLSDRLEQMGVHAACALNRVAYPSFCEVRYRVSEEGGITSCAYDFTEMIKPDWPERFPPEELARWGIANSMHVISMAHGFIGLPATWNGHRSGSLQWHPSGAKFVGCGQSNQGTLFSYHADWGSTGRWSVQLHTAISSYRLCPLEQVSRKTSALGDWEKIAISSFAPQVKAGIAEQVAAMLDPEIARLVPLPSLRSTAALTKYSEDIFGYNLPGPISQIN